MPIYEFKCTNTRCSNLEEHLLKLSDPLPAKCQKCSSPLEKLVSQTSFSLKGSGWYVTDYKSSNSSSTSGSSHSESSSESKSESSGGSSDGTGSSDLGGSGDGHDH